MLVDAELLRLRDLPLRTRSARRPILFRNVVDHDASGALLACPASMDTSGAVCKHRSQGPYRRPVRLGGPRLPHLATCDLRLAACLLPTSSAGGGPGQLA